MEIQKHSLVVLTPSGEFVRCRRENKEYELGEEILFPEAVKERGILQRLFVSQRFAMTVSSMLVAFLIFLAYTNREQPVMAYVAVDINPSVEASVDGSMRVLSLEAYNEDGKRVVAELGDWRKQPLEEVIRAIIQQSQQDGYLEKEHEVTITAISADAKLVKNVEQTVESVQKAYKEEQVTVVYQTGTLQAREIAKSAGVSTGIYMREAERLQREEEKRTIVEQMPQEVTPQPTPPPAVPPVIEKAPQPHEHPANQPIQKQDKEQKKPSAPSIDKSTEKQEKKIEQQERKEERQEKKQEEREKHEQQKEQKQQGNKGAD